MWVDPCLAEAAPVAGLDRFLRRMAPLPLPPALPGAARFLVPDPVIDVAEALAFDWVGRTSRDLVNDDDDDDNDDEKALVPPCLLISVADTGASPGADPTKLGEGLFWPCDAVLASGEKGVVADTAGRPAAAVDAEDASGREAPARLRLWADDDVADNDNDANS